MDIIAPSQLNWVDLVLVLALVLSMIVGVWRGFVFEVMALAGWVAAFFVAQLFGGELGRMLPIGTPGDAINHAVGIALAFFGTLIGWGLLSRLVRMLVRATPLSGVDRVLGAAFGVLRAVVLWLVIATVVLMTPAGRGPAWQRSFMGPWLTNLLMTMRPLLPAEVLRHLPKRVLDAGGVPRP